MCMLKQLNAANHIHPNHMTKKIHLKYLECVQGKLPNRIDWLTPIY